MNLSLLPNLQTAMRPAEIVEPYREPTLSNSDNEWALEKANVLRTLRWLRRRLVPLRRLPHWC